MNIRVYTFWTRFLALVFCVTKVSMLFSHKLSPQPCKTNLILLTNKTKIDCSNRNISSLPLETKTWNVAAMVTDLDLSNNYIEECGGLVFTNYGNLIELNLHDNQIKYFHLECFAGLPNLRSLDIRFNKIKHLSDLPSSVFQPLPFLEELYLSAECAKGLPLEKAFPGGHFASLKNLKIFSITGLPLGKFPAEFQRLTSLREVYWAYQRCVPNPVLPKEMFQNLRQSPIDTLSIVSQHGPFKNTLNVQKGFEQFLPKLTRLNFGCTYQGLERTLDWIRSLSNHTFTHLLLDRLIQFQDNSRGVIIKNSTFCGFGGNVKTLSIRDNGIAFIENTAWKCLPKLTYLSVGKNTPTLTPGFTYHQSLMNMLPLTLETLVASYFMLPMETSNTVVCYSTHYKKKFDDWIEHVPRLPSPGNYPNIKYNLTHLRQYYHVYQVRHFKMPTSVKYIVADKNFYPQKYLSGNAPYICNYNPDNDIRMLNYSNVGPVSEASTPIVGFNNLQIIDFSKRGIKIQGEGLLYYFPNLRILKLNDNQLGVDGKDNFERAFSHAINLLKLDISGNSISHLHDSLLNDNINLVIFQAADNKLLNFNVNLEGHRNLRLLSLKGNQLTHLNKNLTTTLDNLHASITPLELQAEYLDLLDAPNDTIILYIRNNLFQCDCQTIAFVQWLQQTPVTIISLEELVCSDGSLIVDINWKELTAACKQTHTQLNITVVIAIFGTRFVLLCIGVFLVYRFRWKLKWYYYMYRRRLADDTMNMNAAADDEIFVYDAFVAHNHDVDRFWVIKTLMPLVEGPWGLRLCVGYRDFLAGGALADTIVDAINKSRKVILLITPAFVASQWCDFEMNMALVSKMNDIVIINKESVLHCRRVSDTLLALLKGRLYIEWTEDPDGKALFWEKLHDALVSMDNSTWNIGNVELDTRL